jgi:hypothetical protein
MFDGVFAWSGFGIDSRPRALTDMVPGAFVSGRAVRGPRRLRELGRTITPDDDVRGGGTERTGRGHQPSWLWQRETRGKKKKKNRREEEKKKETLRQATLGPAGRPPRRRR